MATVYSKIKRFGRNIRMVIDGMGSFLQRQVVQTQEGGGRVFYRKVKKAGYLLFMNIFAPAAVYFKINWLKAYEFIGKKNIRKFKKLSLQPNVNREAIKIAENQAIRYFKIIFDWDPSLVDGQVWIDASYALGKLYFLQGKIEETDHVCQKDAEFRRSMTKAHQFDDLEIEFLPRHLAVGSIGTYEHLDAYIKAEKLGLRPSKKLILLVNPTETVNNPCYLNYRRKLPARSLLQPQEFQKS